MSHPSWSQFGVQSDVPDSRDSDDLPERKCCGRSTIPRLKQWLKESWLGDFFLGNTMRSGATYIIVMVSWWMIVNSLVQLWIDTKTLHSEDNDACASSRSQQADWWIIYIVLYSIFILIVAPLIAVLYNSGHRPLFLATMELGAPKRDKYRKTHGDDNPNYGKMLPEQEGGSYQMIRLAVNHLEELERIHDVRMKWKQLTESYQHESRSTGTVTQQQLRSVLQQHSVNIADEPFANLCQAMANSKRLFGADSDRYLWQEFVDKLARFKVDRERTPDREPPTSWDALRLELPTEKRMFDDGREKLSRPQADRLMEFVSMQYKVDGGQTTNELFHTIELCHCGGDGCWCKGRIPFHLKRVATRKPRPGKPLQWNDQWEKNEFVAQIAGMASIGLYERLLLLSWLLTIGAIVNDMPSPDPKKHDVDVSAANPDWRDQIDQHKSLVLLLIYYVLILVPQTLYLRKHGYGSTCFDRRRSKMSAVDNHPVSIAGVLNAHFGTDPEHALPRTRPLDGLDSEHRSAE